MNEGTFTIHRNERSSYKRVGLAPGSDDMGVKLGTHKREQEDGAALESEGKSEGVGETTRAKHVAVESESLEELSLLR